MDTLIWKKIILHLLDCTPKTTNEIADEIDKPLASVENQLTALVSENICEKINQDEISQYVIKKDIETFARLVKAFLSDKEEHKEEIGQFVSSDYYFSRIDNQLVDYVLRRFYLDSAYQTNEDREAIRKMLIVFPSVLFFALYGDTTKFYQLSLSRNKLAPLDVDRGKLDRILHSQFQNEVFFRLIPDVRDYLHYFLVHKIQLRVVSIDFKVSLGTSHEKYFELIGDGTLAICRMSDNSKGELPIGQSVSFENPMDLSNYGLAYLYLGKFETAHKLFNDALDEVQDPIQRAEVWNNKGLTFLRSQQYPKAIECFEEGIALDSEDQISQLRDNRQIAEEYLARVTDADNLSEPTQIRFVQNQPVPFEETLFYEFKEIKGNNPTNRITKDSDEYAVAFLNREGGRIFWGIRNKDRITTGVILDDQQRDEVRRKVSEKLGSIDPPISVEDWHLKFHNIYDFQAETIENLWVIELVVPPPQETDVFYTNSGKLFVKTDGGRQKLQGAKVTEFIRRRLQNDTEAD